jgi:hypothetical protein
MGVWNAKSKPEVKSVRTCLHLRGVLAMLSILGTLVAGCLSACGGSSTQAVVHSPTPDSVSQTYVALVHNYWIQILAADEFTNGVNVAARVCLGKVSQSAASDLKLIDPSKCQERAVASIAVHQKFLSDLNSTPAPPKFAADDQAFRSQLPLAIADLKAMITSAKTGSKSAVLQASSAYVNDMIPTVTDALDSVDPSVVHN